MLLFQEVRGYYLNVPYQWGDPVNQGVIQYPKISGPDALHSRLSELEITLYQLRKG